MKKILVIGDIILDKYTFGSSTRLSPEAPVIVLNKDNEKTKYRLGGSANLVEYLSHLPFLKVDFISYLNPKKDNYHIIDSMISKLGVKFTYGKHPFNNPIKERFMIGDTQLLRVDDETFIDEFNYNNFEEIEYPKLTDFDLIILSDYNKYIIKSPIFDMLKLRWGGYKSLKDCVSLKIPQLLIAPKTKNGLIYSAEYSCVNKIEEPILIDNRVANNMIVTLGDKGCYYREGEFFPAKYVETGKKKVVDTTGAGDIFLGTLAASLSLGYNIHESCVKAVAISSNSVEFQGANYTPTPDDINLILEEDYGRS